MSGIIFGGTVTPSRLSPNLFKNPNFAVIQGTASGTLANSTALPTASLGYQGETEWCIAASGGTPAYAFSSANESVTFTGAASTTAIYLLQRLESRDVVTLANKLATVTFSAEISNSLLTSVIWEVFRPTTTADTHGTIDTPTQTLIASGTFTVNSTLTRYSATFTLPALASRGLEIRLRVGAQTSGTWVVSRLQLEEGSVATNFICDDYLTELNQCQRYFRRLSDYLYVYFANVGTLISEQLHTNMFGTTRIRNLIAANPISGAGVSISAGLNEDSTRANYINNAGAGYYGGNPLYTVSAHIP